MFFEQKLVCLNPRLYIYIALRVVQKLRGQDEGDRLSKMSIIGNFQDEKCPRGGR